jgi:hypothetical protein
MHNAAARPALTKPRDAPLFSTTRCGGNAAALDGLVPLVYDELRRVARAQLRREGAEGHQIQTTSSRLDFGIGANVFRCHIDGPRVRRAANRE